jgi:LacI family transcriptional regulator
MKVARRGRNMVTLRDVAQQAGVSQMTVSRVINAQTNVRDVTRKRVQTAIKALRYLPNPAARNLARTGEVHIGIPYGVSTGNYLSELILGALEQCGLSGCHLRLENYAEPNRKRDAIKRLIESGIDGVILPPPLRDFDELQAAVAKASVPAVLIASGSPTPYFSTVSIDEIEAAREMTHYLLGLGHRRLGFIKGHPGQCASDQRLRGYMKAMSEAGIALVADQMAQGSSTYRSGLQAAELLLASNFHPTAIFACNDDMAAATVAIAHRKGLGVPNDIAVAGFDDTPIASMMRPGLTTVQRPTLKMAKEAVELLLVQVRAKRTGKPQPLGHRLLDYQLIKRESTQLSFSNGQSEHPCSAGA